MPIASGKTNYNLEQRLRDRLQRWEVDDSPRWIAARAAERLNRVTATLCVWASLAKESRTPFILAGMFGQKWKTAECGP